MNPRITSYADIEGNDGEARPKVQAPPVATNGSEHVDHEGRGVAIPTYSERHPHRGAERVDLGEPVVDDLMTDGRITLTDEDAEPSAAPAPPERSDDEKPGV